MVAVMAPWVIPLCTETLNPLLVPPALQSAGASFNAPDYLGPRDHGDFRIPYSLVPLRSRTAIVGNC